MVKAAALTDSLLPSFFEMAGPGLVQTGWTRHLRRHSAGRATTDQVIKIRGFGSGSV